MKYRAAGRILCLLFLSARTLCAAGVCGEGTGGCTTSGADGVCGEGTGRSTIPGAVGVCPYYADGQVSLDAAAGEFDRAGMYVTFYNTSDRNVKKVTFNFFLYDADGNPPFAGINSISADYTEEVKAHGTVDFCVSLDGYVIVPPDEPYQVDYIFASRIEYEDGTVWEDPFGVCAMR